MVIEVNAISKRGNSYWN